MDNDLLVEAQIEDGAALIRQLTRDRFEVFVAFWVKRSEEDSWRFYVASSSVRADERKLPFEFVYAAFEKIPDCSFDPLNVKLIAATNPIAVAAVALRDRSLSREPKRFLKKRLGNLATAEICIFPRQLPLEVREVSSGSWQVLLNKFDDFWLTCQSEADARAIAKARVLEVELLDQQTLDAALATELEKTADVMAKYGLGFGTGRLRHDAPRLLQKECVAS